MRRSRLLIISGISGAGKSQALKCFEDFGFFCVDNLPLAMLDQFTTLLLKSRKLKNVALGIDIRERGFLRNFPESLRRMRSKGVECRILFLDASDQAVVQRFSETRHRHPLGNNIIEAIREERGRLLDLKAQADKVIDTSELTLGELKEALSIALGLKQSEEMSLSVLSFGYKYGLPMDADLVMDVRFLPNPNYQPELRRKTGLNREVESFLNKQEVCGKFLDAFSELLISLLPLYIREGKSYLTVAIGCTGGKHRSVFITHQVSRELQKRGYRAREFHRDVHRP